MNQDIHWILQSELQVSQLALDIDRILKIERDFDLTKLTPIPVKPFMGRLVMTDGHHRAAVLLRKGYRALPIVKDEDELDERLYGISVRACRAAGIITPKQLLGQLKSHEEYEAFWPPFCDRYQKHSAYLNDPCRYSSLPLWKELSWAKPTGLEIYHQDQWTGISDEQKSAYTSVQVFFRFKHDLEQIDQAILPEGFAVEEVDFFQPYWADAVAQFLNTIYKDQGIYISAKELRAWPERGVFMPSLWFWINDVENRQRVALAICDFDRLYNEGVLEWIQVAPRYREQGIGKALVNTALSKLRDLGADFATVSGDVNSPFNTERFYKACGFRGNDRWYIVRR